jgi:hypothetical protein
MGSAFRKNSKKRQRKEGLLLIVVKKLDHLEQEDAAGKVCAEKLRSLDVKQRIYAEKLISEFFFRGAARKSK